MQELELIWDEAVKDKDGILINDEYVLARSFKIENKDGRIIIRRFVSLSLEDVSEYEKTQILKSGWVVGTINLSLQFLERDIDDLNNKMRREVNGRRNGTYMIGLKTKRRELIKVYSRLMRKL
jgi:hypothetical protein|tara:strand:+ start:242 stop:610 length:369 start_codon:yes stop_codon:yes gene_type:complete